MSMDPSDIERMSRIVGQELMTVMEIVMPLALRNAVDVMCMVQGGEGSAEAEQDLNRRNDELREFVKTCAGDMEPL